MSFTTAQVTANMQYTWSMYYHVLENWWRFWNSFTLSPGGGGASKEIMQGREGVGRPHLVIPNLLLCKEQ